MIEVKKNAPKIN